MEPPLNTRQRAIKQFCDEVTQALAGDGELSKTTLRNLCRLKSAITEQELTRFKIDPSDRRVWDIVDAKVTCLAQDDRTRVKTIIKKVRPRKVYVVGNHQPPLRRRDIARAAMQAATS